MHLFIDSNIQLLRRTITYSIPLSSFVLGFNILFEV